jgi:hypothetical protein
MAFLYWYELITRTSTIYLIAIRSDQQGGLGMARNINPYKFLQYFLFSF